MVESSWSKLSYATLHLTKCSVPLTQPDGPRKSVSSLRREPFFHPPSLCSFRRRVSTFTTHQRSKALRLLLPTTLQHPYPHIMGNLTPPTPYPPQYPYLSCHGHTHSQPPASAPSPTGSPGLAPSSFSFTFSPFILQHRQVRPSALICLLISSAQ